MRLPSKLQRQRGNSMLEFALVCAFLVPLFAGTVGLGMLLAKNMRVHNVNRDAAVLLVRTVTDPAAGLDLSKPQNQALLLRAADGLGINQAGTYTPDPNGKGVIILSKVIHVADLECSKGIVPAPNGVPPWNTGNCPNYDQYVFAYRIVIGNGTRFPSTLGTPPPSIIQPDGTISDADVAKNTANRAQKFGGGGILTLDQSTFALVAETFADVGAVDFFKMMPVPTLYCRNLL
jgi:hypothetical protein